MTPRRVMWDLENRRCRTVDRTRVMTITFVVQMLRVVRNERPKTVSPPCGTRRKCPVSASTARIGSGNDLGIRLFRRTPFPIACALRRTAGSVRIGRPRTLRLGAGSSESKNLRGFQLREEDAWGPFGGDADTELDATA